MQLDQFAAETCKEFCMAVSVLNAYANSTQFITSISKDQTGNIYSVGPAGLFIPSTAWS